MNVAARLESLANPGGVCISGTVFDQVEGKLDHVFQDLGPQTVKNIAKPVRVYRVQLEGGGARPATVGGKAQPALPDKASIAVLPFDNLSRDPEQESFSDGLTESLITTLSKAPGLFVIARSSSFVYKGKSVSAQEVARDLGVAFVLEGSIQRLGNRMRINAQLIDGQSGHHVWAERYDRTTDDLFLLQDDITFNILTACQVQLTEGEPAKLLHDRGGQPNLAAIELHWQAMEKFRSYTQADNAAARSLWERCLAMDEPDATRLAMLGYTHVMDAKSNWSEDRKASLAKAEDVAAEAETLNSRNVTAKTLRANIAQLRKEFDEAVDLARQAVEIEPGSADSQYVLGIMLNYAGQPEQAIGAMGKAMRLSPFYPTSYLYQLGISKFLLRQHDQAIDIFERCRQRNPNSRSNYVWMATVNAEAGNEAAASVCARQAMDLDPELTVGSWIATEPFKERDVIQRIITAMQCAGFRDE